MIAIEQGNGGFCALWVRRRVGGGEGDSVVGIADRRDVVCVDMSDLMRPFPENGGIISA